MMQEERITTPLLNTRKIQNDKITMAAISLFSTLGYLSMFLQNCKKDGNKYETSEILMHSALTIGVLTSVAAVIGARIQKEEAENVTHLTTMDYAQHIAKRMFKPHVDLRRFYAFGTLLSNVVLLPGDILCFGNLVAERFVLQSLYTAFQFSALTVPKDSSNAFLAWGLIKGAFQIVSLGVVATQDPKEYAATIGANVCFEIAALAAIASAIKTKCADRKAPTSDGLGV